MALVASARVWNLVRQMSSVFMVLKKLSTMALSYALPLPDMDMAMPFPRSFA